MRHYTHRSLTDAIRDGLASLGNAPGTVNQCRLSAAPKGRGSFEGRPSLVQSWSPSVYNCCESSFLDYPVWRPSGTPMHTVNARWQTYGMRLRLRPGL